MALEFKALFSIHILLMLMQFGTRVAGEPKVPGYFIFGDSFFDSGNNNALTTIAKVNYLPYGIDFPLGATGRFTNGRTRADIIGQLLGFDDFIPANANATDQQIKNGVNYASGGSGIRDESGMSSGEVISLNEQIRNHRAIVARLLLLQLNVTFTQEYLRKSIYVINMGTNDYLGNYFMPNSTTGRLYNIEQYAEVLILQYSLQLKTLYSLGARKIAIFGVSQIGCTPFTIANFGTGGKPCNEALNNAVNIFNDKLKPLVDCLNNELVGAKFTFINITSITSPDPPPEGVDAPCCQVGGIALCIRGSIPCANRASTDFYDGIHSSEVLNIDIATRSFTALSPTDVSPFDIGQLANL